MRSTEHGLHIVYHPLPALLVLWPLVCALLVTPLGCWRESVRNGFVLLATGVALLGAAALVPLVAHEHVIGATIPLMVGELVFAVDSFGMLFALFTGLLWFAATLYSLDYLRHEKKRDRFHTASLVVLSAMLGVVLAGDLITLYLFFEVLGLTAFLLVIHTETQQAKLSAIKYFWMTVIGGFVLIGGIFLTYAIGGHGALLPLPLQEASETLKWVTFGLLVLGFGVKAGMLPVHVWLPDAHPVAPSPASALLSGVMIKAGAYGIFRTATALFRPPIAEDAEEVLWHATAGFGLAILWIGIATMFIGVVMALGQHNAKRMLAYHSVSQMGFILVGIGAAAYLGTHGAMGVAGGLYHVVNHALFKGALFLGVGAVAFRTGELDMYKLGGLWRKMPLTFVLMLVAAFGITGVPLFNGFVSKCLIHHALVEAFEYEHLASLGIAEKIFIVTCGGTACSFIKLIGFVFLGTAKREYGPEVKDAPPRMLVAMGMLAAVITVLGVRPDLLLRGVFAPGLHTWGLHADLLDHYLEAQFLSPADLMSVVVAFAIGVAIFVVGMKFGLFHRHAPAWFGVNFWYLAGARGFVRGCGAIQKGYEAYLRRLPVVVRPAFHAAVGYVTGRYGESSDSLARVCRNVRGHVRRAWHRSERRLHRLGAGLATRSPELRAERFIRGAALVLARERQHCVRDAVDTALDWLRQEEAIRDPLRSTLVGHVRDVAGYMGEQLAAHRLDVLEDLARRNELDSVSECFEPVVVDSRGVCDLVSSLALDLGRRRLGGEDVSDELAIATSGLLREERFATRLRAAARSPRPLAVKGQAMGMGRLELAAGWVADVVRLLAEASTQEHTELFSTRVDAATVIATRARIQRYARDMSLNVAVIVVLLLVLIAAIAAGL